MLSSWDRPLPSAAWFSSFTSRPCGVKGDKTTSCLKCRAVKGAGAMDRCYQASKAAGEPSAGLMGETSGGEALQAALKGQGGVVRSPQGVEEIRD